MSAFRVKPSWPKLYRGARGALRTSKLPTISLSLGRMEPHLLRRREAIALLAAIAVAWGTSWPVIKAILQDLPPMWTTALRSIIGTAILFAISAFRRNLVLPPCADIPLVLNHALLQ